MRRIPLLTGLFLLCMAALQDAAFAQDSAASDPFPPEIRAPDEAEQLRLDAGWRMISFGDTSAYPRIAIDAIVEIRPLVAETYGSGHPIALRLDTLEASNLAKDGKHAEAEAIFAANTLALDRRLGPDKEFSYTARELRGGNLIQMGRLTEATALYEENARQVSLQSDLTAIQRARLGLSLAYLRRMQGRFADAETLARAAVDAERAATAPEPQFEAAAVASLGRALTGLGRMDEAVALIEETLARYTGQDSPRARLLFALGEVHAEAGHPVDAHKFYSDAAKLLLEVEGYNAPNTLQATARTRAATVEALGASSATSTAMLFDGLPIPSSTTRCKETIADLNDAEGSLVTASVLASGEETRDCLAKVRTFLDAGMGSDAPLTLHAREQLAASMDSIGDSEPALEEARTLLAARERVNGPNHPATARAALLYARTLGSLGRVKEARVLEARAAVVLPAETYSLQASQLDSAGAHLEAAPIWKLAEEAFDQDPKQALGLAIEIIAGSVFNALYRGDCSDAVREDLTALVSTPNYLLLGDDIKRPSDEAHAIMMACEGKWAEANEAYFAVTFGTASEAIAFHNAKLARIQARRALILLRNPDYYQNAWFAARDAAFYARERRYTPDRDAEGKPLGYRREGATAGVDPLAIAFSALIALNWAYDGKTVTLGETSFTHVGMDDAFRAAQDFAQSTAAASLLESAARSAVTDPDLIVLLDRQAALAARLAGAATEAEADRKALADVTLELRQRFPGYANTARPFGLSVAETRERLKPGEAVLFVQPVGEDVYSFAVSTDSFAWNRASIKRAEMDHLVQLVRCRVDLASCSLALDGEHLFEGRAAASLYGELIAPVAHGFGDAQTLYTVTGGSLGNIPLGILVVGAAPGQSDDQEAELAELAKTQWLGSTYALATLPSVSSLRAYGAARERLAASSFVGIGDPVLGPPQAVNRGSSSAKTGNVRSGNGLADRTMLKSLNSLPGTRRELLTIAQALGASEDQLLLAEAASEAAVKSSQAIAGAGIIAFATHAMLPGELAGSAEPGLVLTPPDNPSSEDDGYLTASEAAALKLDADWVLLSACNTAGPADGETGESLSGLARAFFLAGARSLLVSHWPVLDTVGAAITSETFRIAAARPQISRAEALRLALRGIRTGQSVLGEPIPGWQPAWADPWAWAPFSLVETGT